MITAQHMILGATVPAAGADPLQVNLVSYWKLDETSMFTTRSDSFGSNHLTDSVGTSGVAGKQGNCAYFEKFSRNNYLSCASNSSLQMSGNTDFTIACWVKTVAGVESSLVTKDSNVANSRDYTLDNDGSSTNTFRFYIKGGATYIVSTTGVTTGIWYFLVAWYDSSNGQVHIRVNDTTTYNGAATGATGTDVSAAEFRIGGRVYSGFEDYAAAYIDEVGIWKRLLTSTEITYLYNGGAGRTLF